MINKRPKIVILDDEALAFLGTSRRFQLDQIGDVDHYRSAARDQNELVARLAGADALINIKKSYLFNSDLFNDLPQLKIISYFGIGIDHFKISKEISDRVLIKNTPGVSAGEVAEHAFALLLGLSKKLLVNDRNTRQGIWFQQDNLGLQGKKLGLVGAGDTAAAVNHFAKAFGMETCMWTRCPSVDRAEKLRTPFVELDVLFKTSDVISLHLPLFPNTRGMITRALLKSMKPSAFLLNLGRGGLYEEKDLYHALKNNWIAGAGLDVFENEPLNQRSPFFEFDNVLHTPHIADRTPECFERGMDMLTNNILNYYLVSE
ncbi:NAD(P)-dependent oxidoreductase [Janthinobacterium sp. B9-8]|uniref:NAD(P)-dependent oxidoreductase n=1 Tax=Janthinobacterium sp. B9-8 TaxID=1236179 RepID=UPI00069A651A|nr:NAD(P)-dependent oxidoreductase [Janthinobacterium sp. B9-8]AMC33618.1 hypothetical protein VN23_02905 [Janthinobacterium sp. B9-8]